MLEIEFTPSDLATTRFAISPLWEVVAAVLVLKSPTAHPIHSPWADQIRPRLAASGLDWSLLSDLVPANHIAGFVAPPPATPVPDLALELANLRALPAERIRESLDDLTGPHTKPVQRLYADPDRGIAELCEVVEAFWDLAMAPYWARIRAVLDGDIHHRARQLIDGGATALLNNLYPRLSWDNDRLYLKPTRQRSIALNGRGLLLVPSVFVWPNVFTITTEPWQPTIRYPPRGVATLWETPDRSTPDALSAVLGRTRALLLTALTTPASTTELALSTGLSAAAVSQHLTALRDAGFVTAHRSGRYVLYARTTVAESLLSRPNRT